MHDLINAEVDLDVMPEVKQLSDQGVVQPSQVTVGDLHGNAIKLLYILLEYNIITNFSQDEYDFLVQLYKTDVSLLTAEEIALFDEIVDNMQYLPGKTVRLLGDVFADRGSNDYWTLKLLQKCKRSGVSIEILLSNHDYEIIKAYEFKEEFEPDDTMEGQFTLSMQRMQTLIDKDLISLDDMADGFKALFLSSLKIVSYTLNEESDNITIYSHAPIDLDVIASLAEALKVEFKAETILELARTLDSIQEQFTNYIKSNEIHTFLPDGSPNTLVMYNRNFKRLQNTTAQGYTITYFHGHTNTIPVSEKQGEAFTNFNSYFGMPGFEKGNLLVAVSHDEFQLNKSLDDVSTTGSDMDETKAILEVLTVAVNQQSFFKSNPVAMNVIVPGGTEADIQILMPCSGN